MTRKHIRRGVSHSRSIWHHRCLRSRREQSFDRIAILVEEIGSEVVNVMVYLVGGENLSKLSDAMARSARYVPSGTIAVRLSSWSHGHSI